MTACNPADECGVCGRCTMCRTCDTRLYDHGGPLPETSNVTVNVRAKAEGTLRAFLRNLGISRTIPTVECDPGEFIHHPDDHAAMHYPDGVLHTFTGPDCDGRLHTWHVTTRHPENTA